MKELHDKIDNVALSAKAMLETDAFKSICEQYTKIEQDLIREIIDMELLDINAYVSGIYSAAQKIKTIRLMIDVVKIRALKAKAIEEREALNGR